MLGQLILWTLGAAVLIGGAMLSADPELPGGGLAGTQHDFTKYGFDSNQMCLPCHTPHNDDVARLAPRWQPSADPNERFALYGVRGDSPGTGSRVCLSCHDGGLASDSYGGVEGDPTAHPLLTDRAVIGRGGDLSGDHPVGINYPDFDRGFKARVLLEAEGYVPLLQGKVECASCHDVHNQYGHEKLLVRSNERSALCLSCHQK
jgi:predicted CXXCH cytochrome family protein